MLSGVVISVNYIIELKMEVVYLLQVHFNEKCHGLVRFWLSIKSVIKSLVQQSRLHNA